jgi:hypothetical protein
MNQSSIKVAAILAAIFVSTSIFAQSDWNATLTGSAEGGGDQTEVGVTPSVGLTYQQKQWLLNSQWQADFHSESSDIWNPNWNVNNSFNWHSSSNFISTELNQKHSDLRQESKIYDTISGDLSLSIPWTDTIAHQVNVAGTYQSKKGTSTIEDESVTFRYGLNWASSERSHWQVSASHSRFDSGSDNSDLSLTWTRIFSRIQMNNSISTGTVNEGRDSTDYLGFQSTATIAGKRFNTTLMASRSQTDALSFFDNSFIDVDIKQQMQLEVDQISVQISELELFRKFFVDGEYLLGESRVLTHIDLVDLRASDKTKFEQYDINVAYPYGEKNKLTFSYHKRMEDGSSESNALLTHSSYPTSATELLLELKKTIEPENQLTWLARFTYRF